MANQTINKVQINGNPETYDVEDAQARQGILDLTQKTSQLKEDLVNLENEQCFYDLDKSNFENGTAYIDNSNIYYEDATDCVRVKAWKSIPLNVGDYIEINNGLEYRLLNYDTKTMITDWTTTKTEIVEGGNYTIVVRTSNATLLSIDVALNSLLILNINSMIGRKINDISKRIKEDSFYLELKDSEFELGTVYTSDGNPYYADTNTVIRAKSWRYVTLNAGSKIIPNGVKVRLIYNDNGVNETLKDFTNEKIEIEKTGLYTMAISKEDSSVIEDIAEVLSKLTITNGDNIVIDEINAVSKRVTVLENKVDNSAKSVFAIMSYNCGGWYNGSSNRVPEADYERFLTLQENIIDRYMPDVICLQEYHEEISSGKYAPVNLLGERYYFIESAKNWSNYDGKAICTNRSLVDAVNVEFKDQEGDFHRNYEKAYIYFNGKKVCVISTHTALGASVCALNCTELLNAVSGEEYVIICMDSNIDASDKNSDAYISTLKQFTDAGYRLVNDGTYKTYPITNVAIDNIVVTPNINVKSVVVDTQKDGLAEGADHYPLIAYLEVF